MKNNKTPDTYFTNNAKVRDIRRADSMDILDGILEGNYEKVKGLISNSILHRLEQKHTFKEARKKGGKDMENHIFN